MKKHRALFVLCAFGVSLVACGTSGGGSTSVSSHLESSISSETSHSESSAETSSSVESNEGSSSSSESISVAPSFEAAFYAGFSKNYSAKVTKGTEVEESVFTESGVYHKSSEDGVFFVEEKAYSFAKDGEKYIYSDGTQGKKSTLLAISASEYMASYDASAHFASSSFTFESETDTSLFFVSSGESDKALKFACTVAGMDDESTAFTKVEVKQGKVCSISIVKESEVLAVIEFSEIGSSVLGVEPSLYVAAVTEGGEAGKDDGASEEFEPNVDPEPVDPDAPAEGESAGVKEVNEFVSFTKMA